MSVYARILRSPGVAVIVFATLIGRMPIGISGLAILLFVRDVTGSFASAGLCAGALALGSAIGAPLQGRLIDRRGVRMLLPLAALHAAGLLVVLAAGEASAATAVLAGASLVAGAATPPVSSVLRSHWPYLLAERPELIPGAYALDSVMIELIFVTGPLVTTVVVATVGAQYALLVSAACAIAGVLLMLGGLRGRPGPSPTAEGGRALGLGALAAPGLRTLVLASLPVGFTLGTIEVVLPAFSAQEGSAELAGVLLAVWSGASGLAGLAWGAFGSRRPLIEAHLLLAWLLPLAIAPLLLAGSPLTMAALVVFAGLPIAPLIASRNQLVGQVAPAGTSTEAFTWPLTALVAGVALGAATAGVVIEASSWAGGVVVAMAVGFVGATVVGARRGTLTAPVRA
ncbi:MAG: MFS transporter [Thermoleophilaceae bacterium]